MECTLQGKWKWSRSAVLDSAAPWTVAHQAPPSMGFSRQEYWNRLPFPSAGDLPDPGIEPRSPALQAGALTSEPPGKPWCGIKCSFLFSEPGSTCQHSHFCSHPMPFNRRPSFIILETWWAVYGVAQSQTRLKQLSSSSAGFIYGLWLVRMSGEEILTPNQVVEEPRRGLSGFLHHLVAVLSWFH